MKPPSHPVAYSFSSKIASIIEMIIIIIIIIIIIEWNNDNDNSDNV